jgi:hypothetical protein
MSMAKIKAPVQIRDANAPSRVRVMVELPETIYDQYVEQAIARNRNTEEVLTERLCRTKDHTALNGLYFNDDEKRELEKIIGHMVGDAAGALLRLKTTVVVDVGDVKVELDTKLVARLRTRVFRGQTFEGNVQRETKRGLEEYVGMRPKG